MATTTTRTTARKRQPRRVERPASQEPITDLPVQKPTPARSTKSEPASKAVKAVAKMAPPPPAVDDEPTRPTAHNGIEIVEEELRRNLPHGGAFKISRLKLVDGTTAFACRDCLHTDDTIALVMKHRNAEHGSKYGKKAPKVIFPRDTLVGDFVLPPRGDKPAPTNPMELTLAEILALAPSYAAMIDLLDRTEAERDAAVAELAAMRSQHKDAAHALSVYPALQDQVVELRLKVKDVGSFDEMKAELLALRLFKKNITKKLESLGFSFIDDDSSKE